MQTKICTKCGEEKEFIEFCKRKGKSSSECKICHRQHYHNKKEYYSDRQKAYYSYNKESILEKNTEYRIKNKDKFKVYNKRYVLLHPIKRKESVYKYDEKNREVKNKKARDHHKKYPEKGTARRAQRRAAEVNATPIWADGNVIKEIYKEAKRISKETKVLHHVDHIIPLRGKIVSGLHVEWNLQIIPAIDNLKKSNKVII